MSQVAFHFNAPDKTVYACRLLRKATGQGAKVVVTGHADELDRLDHALWTFGAVEFLPHCRGDASNAMIQASPVILSGFGAAVPEASVLVHLGGPISTDTGKFEKIIEIVGQGEGDRQEARLRWKQYAALGHQLVHHDVAPVGRANE
jgi:DNA polymerase-3 subunit chi